MKKSKTSVNRGITGHGEDFTVYVLSFSQTVLVALAGFVIGFGASYLYFESVIISLVVGLFLGYYGIGYYRNSLLQKRKKELRLQFRDMLESLSNSFTVGKTASAAFRSAYEDMKVEHGEKAYITRELRLICAAHDNRGIEIKDMVNDFAARSGLDDVKSFAGVFSVSTELGGNIAKVIRETRDMIGDKIEVEMEIQTMVTGEKNQLNILMIMPLVMSVVTRMFTYDASSSLVLIVKIVALCMFIFAYWLGTKIVDIRV